MTRADLASTVMQPIDSLKFDAVIPAAGKGLRLGGDIPKQYLTLNGLPLLSHTLRRVLALNPQRVILVVSEDDAFWRKVPEAESCEVVHGGMTRAESVLNGIVALDEAADSDQTDWVVVHDAARPCLRATDVARLISTAGDHAVGGILGAEIVETVKYAVDGAILDTYDRDKLWLAQTPQLFRRKLLKMALEDALSSVTVANDKLDVRSKAITDEASALERTGFKPLMVEGSKDNIKVTNAADLELAAFYLQQQQAESDQEEVNR